MVDREAKYGQVPNRITDVDTFLSLNTSFRELERLIESFGRTLSDNERRLQQTLPGMIKTFDKVEKQYRASGGKLSGSQAADLKVMIAHEENILKWLNDLSKFNPKTGLARNDRNDQSFIQYASIFNDVLEKLTASMEKSYRKWDEYGRTVDRARQAYGLAPVGRADSSHRTPVTPVIPTPAVKSANSAYEYLYNLNHPQKSISASLEPMYKELERLGQLMSKAKSLERLGTLLAQGRIPPNQARQQGHNVQIKAPLSPNEARYKAYLAQTVASKSIQGYKGANAYNLYGGNAPIYTNRNNGIPLTGAGRYAGLKPPTAGQIRAYKVNKGLNKFGASTSILQSLHKALGTLPIIGSVTGLAAKMSKGGSSMKDVGTGLVSMFGKASKLGKIGGLLAGPIGIAIGATAVAVGAIYKQMKKSSPVLQAVTDIMELAWNLLWMPLGNALGTALLPMAEWMINFAIAFNRLFSDFSWENLIQFYYSALQMIWGPLSQIMNALPKLLIDHWLQSASDFFRAVGLDGVADFFDKAREFYDSGLDWITNFPTHMSDFVTDLITKLKAALKDIFNLGDSAKNISEAYEQAKSGDWAGAAKSALKATPGGKVLSMLGVPLASGGIVTSPSFHLIGESGPEAVIPLDKANGFGATYVININGDVYGVSDLESRIERVIQRTANKSYYR